MEPEGSLSCSPEHATGPYPHSIHTFPHHFSNIYSNIILHLCPGLPSGIFTLYLYNNGVFINTSSSSSFRTRTLTRLDGLANWSSSICLSNETFGPRLLTFNFFAFPIFTIYSQEKNNVLHITCSWNYRIKYVLATTTLSIYSYTTITEKAYSCQP